MSSASNSSPRGTGSRITWFWKPENLLLAAGLLALAIYGSARLYSSLYQSYTEYAFEEQLSGRTPSVRGFVPRMLGGKSPPPEAKPGETALKRPSGAELLRSMVYAPEVVPMDQGWSSDRLRKYKKAPDPPPGSVLGRLEIPSIDVSVMLLKGTDDWTLNRAVGHIEGTALPGQPGNLGIAGHRDGFFRPLKDVKKDTVITLTTLEGRFHYRVKDIHIVRPKDVHLLAPTRHPTLTLVTCYPFHYVGDALKRYVVTAEIFKVQDPNELAAEYAAAR